MRELSPSQHEQAVAAAATAGGRDPTATIVNRTNTAMLVTSMMRQQIRGG